MAGRALISSSLLMAARHGFEKIFVGYALMRTAPKET